MIVTCCARFFFFQAEDGIRDLVRSRGLGDVYKRQALARRRDDPRPRRHRERDRRRARRGEHDRARHGDCLLYTSDAADERSSVDLGGSRILKKKKNIDFDERGVTHMTPNHITDI